MFYRLLILFSAALIFCSGCSKKTAPDPPTARAELTVRLYDTLKEKRYTEALAINDKLLALDPNDADLMEMRDRIIGNIAALNVQKYVDKGRLEKAYSYIRKERKNYPVMPRLRLLEEEVKNLIVLRNAARKLAEASTIPELTAALEHIVPLAAKYPAAKQLDSDIALRKAELKKMREDAASAIEKAAQKTAPAVVKADKKEIKQK